MTRLARCCCGSLHVETSGDPAAVVACHCGECQRRTGSPFGVGAYFEKEKVRIEGPSKVYVRDGQEGRKLRMHFCPTCGTNLLWESDLRPDYIGVAVGAFVDPTFPAPDALRVGGIAAQVGQLRPRDRTIHAGNPATTFAVMRKLALHPAQFHQHAGKTH